LRQIAANRSVYAPDLPGFGESDAAPSGLPKHAALAVADLAADLRLRQIDVLGVREGGWAALELAATEPRLVRRLVLVGVPPLEPALSVTQETLVLAESAADLDAAPPHVAARVAEFLEAPLCAAPG
jgi:pimeloyl-ACP methyl ester carboxylesterase